jgi:hypothetical protein
MRVPSYDYSVSRIPPKLRTESVNKNLRPSDAERYPRRVQRKVVRVSGKPTQTLVEAKECRIGGSRIIPKELQTEPRRPSRATDLQRQRSNLLFTIAAYETHAFWRRLNMEWAPVAEHIGARFIFGRAYILASARPKPRTAPAHSDLTEALEGNRSLQETQWCLGY